MEGSLIYHLNVIFPNAEIQRRLFILREKNIEIFPCLWTVLQTFYQLFTEYL